MTVPSRSHLFRVLAAAALAVALLVSLRPSAQAANYTDWVAQVPAGNPTSAQSVRVWINSDTVSGETIRVEYEINGSTYLLVDGHYDNVTYPGATWYADIPAQPNGTAVRYQLITYNQSNSPYRWSGFNWSYTVDDGDIQWDGLRHDTFDPFYRNPFGAVTTGTDVTLRFRTTPLDVDSVALRVYTYDPATNSTSGAVDHPMTYLQDSGGFAFWTITLDTPATPAILYYHFVVTDGLDVDYYGDDHSGPHDNLNQGGTGATTDNQGAEGFQLTVYDPAFETPDWLQNAVVYQIFPDRFRNGDTDNDYCRPGVSVGCPVFYGDQEAIFHSTWNELIYDPRTPGQYFNEYGTQFYGGDLQGLIDKLDYLKAAGFDTIYTTPIFDGSSNHRYDTDNYLEIDPALGDLTTFQTLVDELNARGMHLIVDGVFNHTSSDSFYFDRYGRYPGNDGACESLASEYRDWYEFQNNDAPCGAGDYTGWFGFDSLAVLVDGEDEVRDFIYRDAGSVMETWYDRGVHGWRFDVADEISHDWWRDFRPYAKADKANGPLIGEVWPDASAFLLGDQLDSVMNYRFRKNVLGFVRQAGFVDNDNNGNNEIISLSPSQFDRALRSVREDYPPEATAAMLNLLDSHDTNRLRYLVDIVGESDAQTLQRQKLAALFQYTYMGAPMVYYGDEVALDSPSLANGANGPEDDPYNRAPYPWADEGGDPDAYGPADADMLAFYSRLAELRRQYPFLSGRNFATELTGDTTNPATDNTTYIYSRYNDAQDEAVFILLNPGSSANTTSLSSGWLDDGAVWEDMLTGDTYTVSSNTVNLTLPPRTGVFLARAVTSLTVEKTVSGDTTGLNDWQFSVNGNNAYTLPPAGGEFTVTGIITGTTTVAETAVSGWTAAVSCDNGATGTDSATFNLDTGEDVTCTFTNTQDAPTGDLTITKTVVGTPPEADWAFTGDLGPFNLPASGGGATYSDQATGDYTINETYVPGWATTTSCTPGGETGGRSVTLTLDADEAAECVFTNTLCQPGYYDDMAACVPADSGYYTDTPGAVAPIACAPGYYQPNQGQTSCLQAEAGFYAPGPAATEQTACPAGTTSPPGSDSVDDCVAVATTASLTIVKETDPAGGAGFPFTLDPGSISFVDKWGTLGAGQGDFNGAFGIAIDGDGNVYVSDSGSHRVQKFDADGNFILMWGKDVQVGGVTSHEICLAAESCKPGVSGTGNGEFNIPHGIAIDAAGNVYVADKFNNRIQKFDAAGNYLDQWGSLGDGNGEFDRPSGVAVDAAGNIYVADTDNDRVQKLESDGDFVAVWGSTLFNDPYGLAVHGTTLYVASTFTNFIHAYTTDGIHLFSRSGGSSSFNLPYGIATDSAGNVYVSDSNNDRVLKFAADGTYLTEWGAEGSGDGELNMPMGLAVNAAGHVYVVDRLNERVQVFSQGNVTLDDGQSHTFSDLAPGAYLVSELVPDSWSLDDIACDGGSPAESGNAVSLTLAAGDDVTCTFSNSQDAPPDTTPPQTTIDSGPTGATNSASATFTFSSNEPGSSFTCQLDGGATEPCDDGDASYTGLSEGEHTFSVYATDAAGNPDPTPAMRTWTVDTTPPDTTITANPPNPSNSNSGVFQYQSSEGGTDFECNLDDAGWVECDDGQFSFGGFDEGSHTLLVRAIDAAGNVDPTPASYTWVIDTAAPTVTINQAAGQPDPTSSSPIFFTVVFSEPVTGFATGDVTLSGTAGATLATVSGGPTTYTVSVSGMTSSGTVVATVGANKAQDAAGNDNTASTSTDNQVTYNTTDATPPTVTINQASGQSDPTSSSPIHFTVVFSEPVTGFATGDVALAGTAGATTATVSGGPTTYDVAVTGMANSGTVIATVAANRAQDGAGNGNTASTSTDNQVTYNAPDTTAPTVTINQAAGQGDPTSASPINFTVIFSEPVTGFATGDVTLSGTAGATTAIVTGSGAAYNVAVSGMTGSGTVIATVAANKAQDGAGNGNTASTSTDNQVTYNAPAATGALYVTAAGGSVPGAGSYQKNDILKWNGAAWSVWFDGASAGMLATADIMAFDVADEAQGSAWVVIRQAQKLPGVGKMQPQQIAYYNGSTWTRFFDGTDVGLKTTGERINGLEVLPGSASPIGSGCLYYLLISTTAAGGVPVGSTNVNFTGEDVLGFCMTQSGVNTQGVWHIALEGQGEGLPKNGTLSLSATDDASTLYFTVKSNFTGDGGLIKPSELFSFSGGAFSGPLWKAKDHGLNQVVDGIDVVGVIP